MARRYFKVLVFCLFSAMVVLGCSEGDTEPVDSQTREPSEVESQTAGKYKLGTPITVDDVMFTITDCQIRPVVGDRTEDNVAEDNGEYFGLGSNIVKAEDYEQIELSVSIENKSNTAIDFSEVGWEAELPDGYRLENILIEGQIGKQIPSNHKVEGKVIIIKEKNVNAEKLYLTYNLMDYNEEWQEAIWDTISGDLTKEEYMEKFNPQPVEFEITLEE